MEKILVIVDLEVIIGVTDLLDKRTNENLLYKEILAIVNSIPKEDEIYLCYSHDDGILPDIVKCIDRDLNIIEKIKNIDFSIDYTRAFLIGFHGKKSDECRFPHTFRSEIEGLFLGNKEVGEIEMIVNLLSYYRIPISLISTESKIISYLNYNCIYHNVDGNDETLIYEGLNTDVKKAIEINVDTLKYDSSEVKFFLNKHVLNMAKKMGLTIETYFDNTIDFFKYLPNLHIPLNQILREDFEAMYRNIVKYKPKSLDEIKDEHIKSLLNKGIESLTHSDLYEILENFLKLSKVDTSMWY